MGPILLPVGGGLFLFFLNYFICAPLFSVEFLDNFGSNEGSFIQIAKFLTTCWPHVQWFPIWNLGMPLQHTYFPLMPYLVALWSLATGMTPQHAFHFVTAFWYCLGPPLLFFLVLRLGSGWLAALLAGLAFSLLAPAPWLFSEVARDAGGQLVLERLGRIIGYGVAPQVSGLSLACLAWICVDMALERRRAVWDVCAVLSCAGALLMNAFSGVAVILGSLGLLFCRYPWPWRVQAVRLICLGLAVCGLVGWFLPPSLLLAIRQYSPTVDGDYRWRPEYLPYLLALVGFYIAVVICCRALRVTKGVQFAWSYLVPALGVPMFWFQFRVPLLFQPYRYTIEMELAVCLVLSVTLAAFINRLKPNWGRAATIAVVVLALAGSALLFPEMRRFAVGRIQPATLANSSECRVCKWIGEHVDPDRRIMVPGSASFWCYLFNEHQQLTAGHWFSIPNRNTLAIDYLYHVDKGSEANPGMYSLAWLQAFGVDVAAVAGPGSTIGYKNRRPDKFEGRLRLLWREGDDAVYEVPRRNRSLAHVVPGDRLVRRSPVNGIDLEPLKPYVAALQDESLPQAALVWATPEHAVIEAEIEPGQVISVQVTYHPGWRAFVDGKEVAVTADGLQMIILQPDVTGFATIDLVYGLTSEYRVAAGVSGITLVLLGAYAGAGMRRHPRRLKQAEVARR